MLLSFGLGVGACGDEGGAGTGAQDAGSGGDAADAGTHGSDAASAASSDAKVGEFSLQLVAPVAASESVAATPGFTALLGSVLDGPAVSAIVWEPRTESGDCRLLVPRVPFCEESCGSDICVEDDTCQKSPSSRNAGTLTVRGIQTESGASEFNVQPVRNLYQTPASVKLPYPAFAEGDVLQIEASGGDVPAFSLQGTGIAPLVLDADASYTLAPDQPFTLAWDAPDRPDNSRIEVKLDISHHGGTKGQISCETADDGSLTIPGDMIAELISLGVAGFPSVAVTRAASSSTQIDTGRVEFRVYSYVETFIAVPGVVSCSSDDDCSASKKCRDDKTCG